jgi:hypothetical protein
VGDVVNIKPIPTRDDISFVQDMARFSEGITDEAAIRKKYRLTNDVWEALGNDDDLVRAITDEKTRRVRDGSFKREKSQQLVVRAPDVLSKIMDDDSQSARHRIDSCKVLNDLAANGPENTAPMADRFQIIIRLDADTTLQFDKGRTVDPNDHDPHHPDDRVFPAIAVKKEDGGSGNAI